MSKGSRLSKTVSTKIFSLSMLLTFVVALGVLIGIYVIVNPQQNTSYFLGQNPLTTEPVSLNLNISSPDDNLLVFSPDLLIQGKASPNATVIVSFEEEDVVLEADTKGNFSLTVLLDEGVNQFSISAFDETGNNKIEYRTVYYSKEKI